MAPLVHTRLLLNHLFSSSKLSSLPTAVPTTIPAETNDSLGVDEDNDDQVSVASTTTNTTTATTTSTSGNEQEDRVDQVIELLQDETVDEEDKPDHLKELLISLLRFTNTDHIQFDPLVISLMLRFREDIAPSGTAVPPLPPAAASASAQSSATPTRPTVSRSNSFRRAIPFSMSSIRGPASTTVTPNNGPVSSASSTHSVSAPTSPFISPQPSPWSSPRTNPLALNGAAQEFKFSPGASEFRPGGLSLASSSSSPAATPNISSLNRSAAQAQATWAFTSSPLGTPKYNGSPASSIHSASYFSSPVHSDLHSSSGSTAIPRLPWSEEEGPSYRTPSSSQHSQSYPASPVPVPARLHSSKGGLNWDPFDMNDEEVEQEEEEDNETYTPTLRHDPTTLSDATYDSTYQNQREEEQGMLGLDGPDPYSYSMTPFDVLYSVFAGSEVSAAILEEALAMCGFDVDRAIEYIITTLPGGGGANDSTAASNTIATSSLSADRLDDLPSPPPPVTRIIAASGSRPLVIAREMYDGYVGGNGGRGLANQSTRWQTSSLAMIQQQQALPNSGGIGGRVCRYYLSGNCMRSDCKFSHDVGKAVCKFWLRGHCLKGDRGAEGGNRCDFLHSIPPVMRADFEERARQRSELTSASNNHAVEEYDDSEQHVEFPSLGEAPRSRRNMTGVNRSDPTRSRFSGAVKFGSSLPPVLTQRPLAPLIVQPSQTMSRESLLPQPRASSRITLRPPALLPTLPTGKALASLYSKYRTSFLDLGRKRNVCLSRAADAWKSGDGAAARRWSREAQDWNRQVAIEGADASRKIVEERTRAIRDAVLQNDDARSGSTDDLADRQRRGKSLCGGVVLGVVSKRILAGGGQMRNEERTEVAIDLHGLHPDEAGNFLTTFLTGLEAQRYEGLAFVVVGLAKHTGTADVERGAAAGRIRLEHAVTEFIASQGYAWKLFSGVVCVDTVR